MSASTHYKPCLLPETAEIALTEIKRYIEPRLMDEFQLRRVSAPMFLPAGSPLIDRRYHGAKVHLDGTNTEVEIVASLDIWLRSCLRRFDTAPGFGVFTIMNAMRPDIVPSPTTGVHVAAWSWQQAIRSDETTENTLVGSANRLYAQLLATEQHIIELFPHMHPTLHKSLDILTDDTLEKMMPLNSRERRIYEYLHPKRDIKPGDRHCAALFLCRGKGSNLAEGEMWVWNRRANRPLQIADIGLWHADSIAPASVGGNVYRHQLAMQLLHQDEI